MFRHSSFYMSALIHSLGSVRSESEILQFTERLSSSEVVILMIILRAFCKNSDLLIAMYKFDLMQKHFINVDTKAHFSKRKQKRQRHNFAPSQLSRNYCNLSSPSELHVEEMNDQKFQTFHRSKSRAHRH